MSLYLLGGWCLMVPALADPPTTRPLPPPTKDSVSIGYGKASATILSGSIASLSGAELRRTVTVSPLQALQGRLAGLLVTAGSGDPGGAISLQLRGPGHFTDNSPLIVVDGMVMNRGDNLNWLNPQDIRSVEVLRDAASAAVYGMRASNGVLLISTHRGESGKLRITAGTFAGVQQGNRFPALLSTPQYVDFINESRAVGGYIPANRLTNPASLDTLLKTQTDWLGALNRSAVVRSADVSVSGGTDRVRFLVSGQQFAQGGTLLGTDFNRLSLRANTEVLLTPTIRLGQHLALGRTVRQANEGSEGHSPLVHAMRSAPYLPMQRPGVPGGFNGPDFLDAGNDARNAYGLTNLVTDRRTLNYLIGDVYGEWNLTDQLTYRATFGFDRQQQEHLLAAPVYRMGSFSTNVTAASVLLAQPRTQALLEQQLTYRYTYGDHSLTALLAGSRQTLRTTIPGTPIDSLLGDGLRVMNAAAYWQQASAETYRIVSLLGRILYSYQDKYVLTASLRRDGSSRLAAGHRFGLFPALSVGWNLDQEAFWETIPYLSKGKLRASWGRTGSDQIGNAGYTSAMVQNYNYPFGAGSGFLGQGALPSTLPNPGLRWETSRMVNMGLDLSALEESVSLTLDYYRRRTANLVMEVPLPATIGGAAPLLNAGSIDHSGLDLSLGIQSTVGSFETEVKGFASWQRNRVVSLGDRLDPVQSGLVYTDPVSYTQPGYPVGSFYGFRRVGIYQNRDEIREHPGLPTSDAGDIRYADSNGDGKVTEADKVVLGSPIPRFHYGLSLSVSGKGFDVSGLLQGVAGNQLYNATAYWLHGYQGRYNAGPAVLNRWTNDRPSTTQPRANAADQVNFRASDRFLESGSFLRLRQVQIGYTLPQTLTQSWGVRSLRVYIGGQNLLTLTRYSGLDPELGSSSALASGIDFGLQPQPRTWLGGIQLNL